MKKLVIILMLVSFTAVVAYAADTYTYDGGKKGAVTFDHKGHSDNFDCAKCHEGTPAKIDAEGKKAGHAVCKDCHKANKGPTKCGECHVK